MRSVDDYTSHCAEGEEDDEYQQTIRELAHDIQNPLAIATQYLKLARESPEEQHFNEIETALNRIDQLITEELETQAEPTACTGTTEACLQSIASESWDTATTADASFTTDFSTQTGPHLSANPSHMQSLFENLFCNAATHAGDEVTVTVGDLPEKTGFYVEDDGVGIPQNKRLQVFQPGYSTSDNGTGIGLQIVGEVTATYNWELHVTESTDGGARFEFIVPEDEWQYVQ